MRQWKSALLGLSLLALAIPARAELNVDLSYIDPNSAKFDRFEGWATPALPPNSALPYAFSATDAVYLYVATGNGTWAQVAVSIVEDQVADAEAAWSAPTPARPEIAGDSYLEAGPMLRDLALVYAFCPGFITSGQRTRWAAYAEQTLFNVWNPNSATWGGHSFPWSGWSIDNPGNNYYYSFLQATMFWGFAKDPGGTDWIAFLRASKIPPLLTYFQQLAGGGSREGTGYGLSHGRLFEVYELWRQSTPEHQNLGAAAGTHLADSIEYWRHATLPTFDRYAPIGDLSRESYPNLYDYHRTLMLKARAALASAPGGATAAARATWWLNRISVDEVQSGFNLRDDLLPAGQTESPPSSLIYHAPGVGHFFARSDWSESATWMSFMAGPFEESHAHQDQGAFTLFRGDFLAVTENIFTHSGIQQGTEVHNVLRFEEGGDIIPQRNAATSLSIQNTGRLRVAADLTPFYASSSVNSWQRDITFDAGKIEVHDVYTAEPGVEVFFQVQTPVEPQLVGNAIEAGDLRIVPIEPANPAIEILEWSTLDAQEFNDGWRVSLSGPSGSGEMRVRLETGANLLFADGFESGNTAAWSSTVP
jgi:hypothetical protein